MVVYERKRVVLVAALALFGYSMPHPVVDAQGCCGYLLGGLAQDALREEGVFASAYDEGRHGYFVQPSGRVVVEIGLQSGQEVRRVAGRADHEPPENLHECSREAFVCLTSHRDGGHVRSQLLPPSPARERLPALARLSTFLRQAASTDDEEQAPDHLGVVEGDVLGDRSSGRESHDVRGSELTLYHPRVVLCHVLRGVSERRAAPAADHVDCV